MCMVMMDGLSFSNIVLRPYHIDLFSIGFGKFAIAFDKTASFQQTKLLKFYQFVTAILPFLKPSTKFTCQFSTLHHFDKA